MTGKVKTVDPRGAEIVLGEDILGYLPASEISRDRVEDARNVLKEGDEVTALVINVDRKTRSIKLSIKAKDDADSQEAMKTLTADQRPRECWHHQPWRAAARQDGKQVSNQGHDLIHRMGGGPEAAARYPSEGPHSLAPKPRGPSTFCSAYTMTRSDLVTLLAERFPQINQRDTEFAVKTILDAMSDALARGHRIEIRGFGSFSRQPASTAHGSQPSHRRSRCQFLKSSCRTSKPGKALAGSCRGQGPTAQDRPD